MRITGMITPDELAWYFINFSPLILLGNELVQHMRIQILILGFKGLNKLNQKLAAAMKNVSSFLSLRVFHFFKKKFLQDVNTTYSHVTPVSIQWHSF